MNTWCGRRTAGLLSKVRGNVPALSPRTGRGQAELTQSLEEHAPRASSPWKTYAGRIAAALLLGAGLWLGAARAADASLADLLKRHQVEEQQLQRKYQQLTSKLDANAQTYKDLLQEFRKEKTALRERHSKERWAFQPEPTPESTQKLRQHLQTLGQEEQAAYAQNQARAMARDGNALKAEVVDAYMPPDVAAKKLDAYAERIQAGHLGLSPAEETAALRNIESQKQHYEQAQVNRQAQLAANKKTADNTSSQLRNVQNEFGEPINAAFGLNRQTGATGGVTEGNPAADSTAHIVGKLEGQPTHGRVDDMHSWRYIRNDSGQIALDANRQPVKEVIVDPTPERVKEIKDAYNKRMGRSQTPAATTSAQTGERGTVARAGLETVERGGPGRLSLSGSAGAVNAGLPTAQPAAVAAGGAPPPPPGGPHQPTASSAAPGRPSGIPLEKALVPVTRAYEPGTLPPERSLVVQGSTPPPGRAAAPRGNTSLPRTPDTIYVTPDGTALTSHDQIVPVREKAIALPDRSGTALLNSKQPKIDLLKGMQPPAPAAVAGKPPFYDGTGTPIAFDGKPVVQPGKQLVDRSGRPLSSQGEAATAGAQGQLVDRYGRPLASSAQAPAQGQGVAAGGSPQLPNKELIRRQQAELEALSTRMNDLARNNPQLTSDPRAAEQLQNYHRAMADQIREKYAAQDNRIRDLKASGNAKDLYNTGGKKNPTNVKGDVDVTAASDKVAYEQMKDWKAAGKDVQDFPHKVVNNTDNMTVWRPDRALTERNKVGDRDAFATEGGKAGTGVKDAIKNDTGWVLDDQKKFLYGQADGDLKEMAKAVSKAGERMGLDKQNPELYRKLKDLQGYRGPDEAGVVKYGSEARTAGNDLADLRNKMKLEMDKAMQLAQDATPVKTKVSGPLNKTPSDNRVNSSNARAKAEDIALQEGLNARGSDWSGSKAEVRDAVRANFKDALDAQTRQRPFTSDDEVKRQNRASSDDIQASRDRVRDMARSEKGEIGTERGTRFDVMTKPTGNGANIELPDGTIKKPSSLLDGGRSSFVKPVAEPIRGAFDKLGILAMAGAAAQATVEKQGEAADQGRSHLRGDEMLDVVDKASGFQPWRNNYYDALNQAAQEKVRAGTPDSKLDTALTVTKAMGKGTYDTMKQMGDGMINEPARQAIQEEEEAARRERREPNYARSYANGVKKAVETTLVTPLTTAIADHGTLDERRAAGQTINTEKALLKDLPGFVAEDINKLKGDLVKLNDPKNHDPNDPWVQNQIKETRAQLQQKYNELETYGRMTRNVLTHDPAAGDGALKNSLPVIRDTLLQKDLDPVLATTAPGSKERAEMEKFASNLKADLNSTDPQKRQMAAATLQAWQQDPSLALSKQTPNQGGGPGGDMLNTFNNTLKDGKLAMDTLSVLNEHGLNVDGKDLANLAGNDQGKEPAGPQNRKLTPEEREQLASQITDDIMKKNRLDTAGNTGPNSPLQQALALFPDKPEPKEPMPPEPPPDPNADKKRNLLNYADNMQNGSDAQQQKIDELRAQKDASHNSATKKDLQAQIDQAKKDKDDYDQRVATTKQTLNDLGVKTGPAGPTVGQTADGTPTADGYTAQQLSNYANNMQNGSDGRQQKINDLQAQIDASHNSATKKDLQAQIAQQQKDKDDYDQRLADTQKGLAALGVRPGGPGPVVSTAADGTPTANGYTANQLNNYLNNMQNGSDGQQQKINDLQAQIDASHNSATKKDLQAQIAQQQKDKDDYDQRVAATQKDLNALPPPTTLPPDGTGGNTPVAMGQDSGQPTPPGDGTTPPADGNTQPNNLNTMEPTAGGDGGNFTLPTPNLLNIFGDGFNNDRSSQAGTAFNNMNLQQKFTQVAQVADDANNQSRFVRDAAGNDYNLTLGQSAQTTAQGQQQNSWGTVIGDALVTSVQQGGQAFGTTLGGAAGNGVNNLIRNAMDGRPQNNGGGNEPAAGGSAPAGNPGSSTPANSGGGGGGGTPPPAGGSSGGGATPPASGGDQGIVGSQSNPDGTITVTYSCGNTWTGKPPAPPKCPKCGQGDQTSTTVNANSATPPAGGDANMARCARCGATWPASQGTTRCPKCNSVGVVSSTASALGTAGGAGGASAPQPAADHCYVKKRNPDKHWGDGDVTVDAEMHCKVQGDWHLSNVFYIESKCFKCKGPMD